MKCDACGHVNIEGARFCAGCGAALPTRVEGANDPMIGQLVAGRFRITGVLGEGGMGVVYVGEQQMGSSIRKVAVKTLHAHLSKDASVQQRFTRECGVVAQLEHPNTIKVYDFGRTDDGTLYIAMEFVSGKPLADVISEQGAMSPERTVHVMRQMCGALDEAHLQGIVHRDLKPENVILTERHGERDFVKVLDFGIAARTESGDAQKEQKLTQQGMVLGTPPYMSPEQFTGKSLDARSDVYSLGVMAYELLTGKLPFEADTPWQWATQHMTAQPMPFEVAAPAQNIPEGMRQAILKALSKDREDRQGSAREFFAELSGGSRMTVEASALRVEAASPGMGYQPTAAMPAVPGFGGAPPGTPTPPGMAQAPMQMAPVHAPMGSVGAIAAPPPARKSGGSNKALLFGLVGVGAVLLLAIGIVAIRSHKSDDVGPLSLGSATPIASSDGGSATVSAEPPVVTPPMDPGTTPPAGGHIPASGGKTPAGKTAPSATATPAATGGGATPGGATPGGTPKPAGDTCGTCISAASSGNIAGASQAYKTCADPAQKSACANLVRPKAIGLARAAAMNQNCSGANAIIAAATAMGAGSAPLAASLNGTSCKK